MEPELPVVEFHDKKKKPNKKKRKAKTFNAEPIKEKVLGSSQSEQTKKPKLQDAGENSAFETMGNDSSDDEMSNSNSIDNGDLSGSDEDAPQTNRFGSIVSELLESKPKKQSTTILTHSKETTDLVAARKAEREKEKADRERRAQKRLLKNKDHRVPEFSNMELEIKLKKTATKGVVKLFNTIKVQQKVLSKSGEKNNRKIEALSKEKFVEILGAQKEVSAESAQSMLAQRHGPSPAKPAGPIIDPRSLTSGAPVLQKPAAGAAQKESSWKILRDDYMLGATMKDWNKSDSDDDGNEAELEEEGDDGYEGSDD